MVELAEIIDFFPDFLAKSPSDTFYKYVDAHQDEVETYENDIDQVRKSHYVDEASGDNLDRIGAIFGDFGKRRGRDDQEYRIFLKSIVQSFKGRGTVDGVGFAVSAGLNVDKAGVSLDEFFTDLEYDLIIQSWTDHRTTTIADMADLADASVSRLKDIVYKVPDDEMQAADSVTKHGKDADVTDTMESSDTVNTTTQTGPYLWGDDDWGFSEWSN